jgi:phosphoglycerol transferase MdoB-like AlkP superfamily enzyme
MPMSEGSEPLPFDWSELVPLLVHPMKVDIVEALRWVGQPLSASDLMKVLGERFNVQFISYHVVKLAEVEALVKVRERPVRGGLEKFYFLR